MHNWDYPKTKNLKNNEVWYLERLLTYGLNKEKINREMLERNFNKIKIPDNTRTFWNFYYGTNRFNYRSEKSN